MGPLPSAPLVLQEHRALAWGHMAGEVRSLSLPPPRFLTPPQPPGREQRPLPAHLASPGGPWETPGGLGSVGQRKPNPAKRQILRREGLGSPSPLPSPGPLYHQCIQAGPPTALPQILRKLLLPCLTPEICVLTGVSWVVPCEPLEGHVPCHPAPPTPTLSCSPAHAPRAASPRVTDTQRGQTF